jgi:hypothetical protein
MVLDLRLRVGMGLKVVGKSESGKKEEGRSLWERKLCWRLLHRFRMRGPQLVAGHCQFVIPLGLLP